MKVEVKTKRIFRKIITVTFFEIFEITKDLKFKPYENEKGERVKFERRASAERFCEKHKLCYVKMKHIFFR